MKLHGDARDQARMALWIWLAALGGAFALAPLTESRAYVIVGFVSAGLVCLTGFGLRTLRTPWPAILLVQLLVLFWWTSLVYAGDTTTGGLIPNADTVRALEQVLTGAMEHSEHYAAPVPYNPDLHAVLAVSVGLLAVAVDLLAGSLQHAPAVGLVFLAVYMAPVALLSGRVSLWFFLPGALAFVFLLAAQERTSITRWGRNISYADSATLSQSRGIYSSGLASAGRRVGFGAVALSAVVPLLIPTFSTNLFGSGGIAGGGGADSSGPVSVEDPVLDMRRNLRNQSDQELLRMTGTSTPQYVRLAALDSLGMDGWEASQRGPNTSNITGLAPNRGMSADVLGTGSTDTFDIDVPDAFDSQWLPTIYAPTSFGNIEDDGDWRIDATNLDVVAGDDDTSTAGMSYVLNIGQTHPTFAQLRRESGVSDDLEPFTDLPSDTPHEIRAQAHAVTRGAGTNFDRAIALEDWFRTTGGFEYSLDQDPTNGMDTIASFVTDDRRGYCEQFASAMAMMARELEIPARVAVGFLSGDEIDDTYVFRGTDMHAWPELYLNDDVGWVTFEPTPGDRTGSGIEFGTPGGDAPSTTQDRSDIQSGRTPTEPGGSNTANLDDTSGGDDSDAGGGIPWRPLLTTALIVALLACLGAAPRWLRSRRRRRRWDNATSPVEVAEAAWAELRDTVRDLRMPWPDGATPRATGRRLRPLVESREHAVDGLNRVVLGVERARYAAEAGPVDLRADVETIAAALASRTSNKTRRKATWMPLSLMGGIRLPGRGPEHAGRQHRELLALEE